MVRCALRRRARGFSWQIVILVFRWRCTAFTDLLSTMRWRTSLSLSSYVEARKMTRVGTVRVVAKRSPRPGQERMSG